MTAPRESFAQTLHTVQQAISVSALSVLRRNRTRLDALNTVASLNQWQAWQRYLTIQLALVDAEVDAVAFEAGEGRPHRDALTAEVRTMSATQRNLFAAVVTRSRNIVTDEAERDRAVAGHASRESADVIERRTLQRLLNQAMGTGGDGKARFPMDILPTGTVDWRTMDRTMVNDVEERIKALQPATSRTLQLVVVAGVAAVVFGVVWWFISTLIALGSSGTPTTTIPQPIINGAVATTQWLNATLTISGSDEPAIPLQIVPAAQWPTQAVGGGVREDAQMRPLGVCVPPRMADALRNAGVVELAATGITPLRRYTLQVPPAPPLESDFVVVACNGDRSPLATGTLTDVAHSVAAPVGTMQVVASTSITIEAITLVQPFADPRIPPQSAEVHVVFRGDLPVSSVPRLVTQTDAAGSTSVRRSTDADGRTTLVYLIPEPSTQITVRFGVETVAWMTTLTPLVDVNP